MLNLILCPVEFTKITPQAVGISLYSVAASVGYVKLTNAVGIIAAGRLGHVGPLSLFWLVGPRCTQAGAGVLDPDTRKDVQLGCKQTTKYINHLKA